MFEVMIDIHELVGAKVVAIEGEGDGIQTMVIQKDNWYWEIIGTSKYPWVTFMIHKIICPSCKQKMEYEPPNGGKHGFLCTKCGHKE